MAATVAGCGANKLREEREARINVAPENYRADILAGLHTYVADPTNIRDAYLSEPALKQVGAQHRYVACVRFNAKNGEGRYTGNKDVVAIFMSGRFDQFVDVTPQTAANQSPPANPLRELCAQADYKRFPELEAMKR